MCGFLGTLPASEPAKFAKALSLLTHRGPDAKGLWTDKSKISLGHRRLAIIDTTNDAVQPMHRHDRYSMVFNGEIYNFLELKRELEDLGERFLSTSDTEVLLAAWARWGDKCLQKLNGMWAFAIWDKNEQQLFLSRDRVGEKPLFYVIQDKNLIFASEQKALLPFLLKVKPSDKFRKLTKNPYFYEGTDECLFEGIKRFPAASLACFKDGVIRINKYWTPINGELNVPPDYGEQVEELSSLLKQSCKLRLRSDVPVATALSGGVDSSAVAASIALNGGSDKSGPKNQSAFVASFPGSVMDETAAARENASFLGLEITEISVSSNADEVFSNLPKIAFLFEDIHEVNPLPHYNLYKGMRDRGVLVSLDGHGGDELFCGYESSILHALPSLAFQPFRFFEVLQIYKDVHPKNKAFKPLKFHEVIAYLAKQKFRQNCSDWPVFSHPLPKEPLDSLNQHLLGLTTQTVLPTLLRNYDRYSMMSGVEVRSPLLDPSIIEFAFKLGSNSKLRHGHTKAILRDAVKPYLPEKNLFNKSKIGFAPPIADWIRGPMKAFIEESLSSTEFNNSELIDSKSLTLKIRRIIEGEKNIELYEAEKIWKEFSIYLWERVFFMDKLWQV